MTFLPIVARELRIAARKRSTFWLRLIAALVALLIGAAFMALSLIPFIGSGGTVNLGRALFSVFAWLSLAAALTAGLFFTSDALSEEKREGTLGFLFLTDLRGYDVVLGKLLATSLRGFYALLAIFPIFAVTLLMGGVTGPQFWKTILALTNALFCSLAVGLCVPALSRESQKALAATLIALVLLVFGGPAVDSVLALAKGRGFGEWFSLTSPGYVFLTAGGWGGTRFWAGLLTSQIVAWLVLGLASWWTPRSWQDKKSQTKAVTDDWSYRFKFGGAKFRAARRQKLIEPNPVLWLACRERWQGIAIWTLSLLTLAVFGTMFVADLSPMTWMIWGYIGGALTLAFYLGIASQACRFLVEARRSGLTELLLSSPLTVEQIVQGQWRALRRMFGWPVVIFLMVQLVASFLSQRATWGSLGAVPGNAPSPHVALLLVVAMLMITATLANLIALGWVGMWMGLTSKSTNLATLKTLLWVEIVPWFVISFVSSIGLGLLMVGIMLPAIKQGTTPNPASLMGWFPVITAAVSGGLSVAKDVFFIRLARRKLYTTFRDSAALGLTPVRFDGPPVIVAARPVVGNSTTGPFSN